MKAFSKILVPTDFSSHAALAMQTAADLSRRYDASLTLVYVFEPMASFLPDGYPMLIGPQLDPLFADLERLLADAKRAAEAAGAVRVATDLLHGFAAGEICELATSAGYDLIVMGTQGRTGLAHYLLGSVAERVVRIAPCPVLTVRVAPRAASPQDGDTASAAP